MGASSAALGGRADFRAREGAAAAFLGSGAAAGSELKMVSWPPSHDIGGVDQAAPARILLLPSGGLPLLVAFGSAPCSRSRIVMVTASSSNRSGRKSGETPALGATALAN